MKLTSLLTEVDPTITQKFHLISPHPFMLHLFHPIHPTPPLAKSVSAFILPLHFTLSQGGSEYKQWERQRDNYLQSQKL